MESIQHPEEPTPPTPPPELQIVLEMEADTMGQADIAQEQQMDSLMVKICVQICF